MSILDNLDKKTLRDYIDYNLISNLIVNEITIKNVLTQEITSDECEEETSNFIKQNNIKDEKELSDLLTEKNISRTSFDRQLQYKIKQKKYIIEKFDHQVESYFLKVKDKLDQVVYSLIRLQDEYKLKELYLRVEDNEDNFNDLAHEFSEGPEKLTRGIIGPVPLSQSHPILSKALNNLKVGEVHEPIRIENFSLLVRLEGRLNSKLDQQTRENLCQELFQQSVQLEANDKINAIIKNLED